MGQPMYICQNCKKAPATIHLTDIHNNVKKELHLCESCAKEKGFNIKGAANLPQLLGIAAKKTVFSQQAKPAPPADDPACPKCGIKWSQFGERGRLGCPEDYTAFDARLRHLVMNQIMQHARTSGPLHTGKRPLPRRGEGETDRAIADLEKRLKRAVMEENYESAAAIKIELDALRERKAGDPGEPSGSKGE